MSLVSTEEIIARQPPEAQAMRRTLLTENAVLKARIEALERRAKGLAPKYSWLPPSKQHSHVRIRPKKHKSKRKCGDQPGHKHARPLIPAEECDDVHSLKPTECRHCDERLSGSDPKAAAPSGLALARDRNQPPIFLQCICVQHSRREKRISPFNRLPHCSPGFERLPR